MSANLATTAGKPAMAWYGEKPWHGQGTEVKSAMTSAEAIKLAGLDWEVEKRNLQFLESDGTPKWLDRRFAVVRKDTEEALGVVGNVYRPLQNKEAFSFFDSIVGEKLAMYHTAGALGAGEKIWLLAKLPKEFWVTPEDKVEQFLLLSNSHDGTSTVTIMATPIRVVCQNTLNMALGGERKTRVRHTLNMGAGIKEIREELGIVDQYFRTFEEMGRHLVSKKANALIVEKVLSDLGLSQEKAKESGRTENIRFDILRLFERGQGNDLKTVRGSTWALLNGIVEYVDYERSARGKGYQEKAESRTASLLFGSGAEIKQKALDSILAVVK